MSRDWFNIRFGTYHLQISPDGITWHQNPYQVQFRKEEKNWKWFAIYCAFGKHFF